MKLAEAVAFNAKRIAAGELTPEQIAYLAEFFQSHVNLEDDGKFGGVTMAALAKYIQESTAPPDPRSPFAHGFFPMCAKRGARARISNKFGAKRDDGKRRHAGCDVMRPRAQPGLVKKPDYLANWYVDSDPEDPVLAVLPGKVTAARWGIAFNGERVLSVTIDHGAVGEFKQLGSFYLHCARLLVKPGVHVDAGQPIAITGHTATDTTHQHDELFTGPTRSGHQIDPAPIFAQLKHRDMEPGVGKFNPEWLRGEMAAVTA